MVVPGFAGEIPGDAVAVRLGMHVEDGSAVQPTDDLAHLPGCQPPAERRETVLFEDSGTRQTSIAFDAVALAEPVDAGGEEACGGLPVGEVQNVVATDWQGQS